MKKLINVSCLILTALLITTCFSPWRGDDNNLTIVWGQGTNSRLYYQKDFGDDINVFWVTIKGPGTTIEQQFKDVSGAAFSLSPGIWNVSVKGGYIRYDYPGLEYDVPNLYSVMGVEQIEIKAGQKTKADIQMYNAKEVHSWEELYDTIDVNANGFTDFTNCAEPTCPNYGSPHVHEQIVVLKSGEPYAAGEYEIDSAWYGSGWITIKRPVTLIAEDPITITRRDGFHDTFFEINWDCLTLGKPGMTGTITIDGRSNINSSESLEVPGVPGFTSPLISVNGPESTGVKGELVMYDGVTLRNNIAQIGGAVCVLPEAVFTMYGGRITGNTAVGFPETSGGVGGNEKARGGGVYVGLDTISYKSLGTFNQLGGTVSGNKPDNIFRERETPLL